jgi:hypothetical protein
MGVKEKYLSCTKLPRDTADCLLQQHWNMMSDYEKAAIRYNALANWMCAGQPATPDDRITFEILGLVEGRKAKNWPISRKEFDEAIDRAILKGFN